MSNPKISVVLPTYNGSRYLRESIESVMAQTFTDWELIIINDCSTDDTLKIAEEYAAKDGRITVHTNPENLKLPRSLNAGFSFAKGEYLTWTSDDNRYKPDAFSVMSRYLDEHKDCGLVYCNMNSIAEDGSFVQANPLSSPEMLICGNTIGACFMYTRAAMESIGVYDSDMFLAEDYDYWLRIYEKFPVVHIEQTLYEYRRHKQSLTGTRSHEIRVQTAKMKAKHLDFILGHLNTKREVRELYYQLKDAKIPFNLEQKSFFARNCPFIALRYLIRKAYFKIISYG